eukprot:COSAG01_NODE_8059_length_2936_cov_1.848784_3_plen_120_part_00
MAQLPEVLAALRAHHLAAVTDLYRWFIAQMHGYAQSRNKTLRVWEGFGPQGGQGGHKPVNASTVVVPRVGTSVSVFDGVYAYPRLLIVSLVQTAVTASLCRWIADTTTLRSLRRMGTVS